MKVKDIMTADPACCTPDSALQEAAIMMVDHDCGEIPVVDNFDNYMPVGVVTDRDIVCRTLARGLNPLEMQVGDCMSAPLVSINPDDALDKCYQVLEENQIRRVPVVDETGRICGIVALADIAERASKADSGEILQQVSAATTSSSNVG